MKRVSWPVITSILLVVVGLGTASISMGQTVFRPDRYARSVVAGAQRVLAGIGRGVTVSFQSVRELRELRREYEALLTELEEYRTLEGRLQQLESENQRLREQLGFAAQTTSPAVAARVIAREGSQYFASFTINRGARHGLERGQTVLAFVEGRESLAGRVETVSGGTAIVVPVFAAGSYVAARLERSRQEGLVKGGGSRFEPLLMSYVPRGARDQIQYQDLVVTSGLNSIFPPDLPLGRVVRVDALAFEPSLEITIEPLVDFSRLEYVFVLTSGQTVRTGESRS
ncbi:MAG: rod shape-determining protein MreC [Spirochaetaceae bacterium]|nr:MAG: rod shape-determining protein MreC [Spirochaetaceae bacterium]